MSTDDTAPGPDSRSEPDPLSAALTRAFGGGPRAQHPQGSALRALEARTSKKLGVHLDSHGPSDAPVKVTKEVRALRDPSGRYQMLGEIGRGGVGIVYKGRDQDLGRDVAMKVLKDEYATRADVLTRFVEEAQIGGQLQHPGIVTVYELGLHAGERPYFAMKLIKGETLAAQLAKRSDATQERRRFLGIFEQICQTMAYAHARRVVHRDLKPANVMIGAFGEVQVVDWGFAKVLQRNAADDAPAATKQPSERSVIETVRSRADSGSHSVVGSMLGTPAYMPPEQARGDIDRVDERSDVFALGAILCEILSGEPPYRAEDGDLVRQAAGAQLDGAHARLARCGADEVLIALSKECLSASQRARPASAAELADRAGAYLTSVEERAREARVRAAEARLKHRVTLLSAAAGLVMLALGAGGWIWIDGQARARRSTATQRVASAMSGASSAHGKAQEAGVDMGLWSTAVASAEQLVSLAESEDVDAEACRDAKALHAQVQKEREAAKTAFDRRARDQKMIRQLELARIPADDDVRKNAIQELRRLDAAYTEAFAEYLGGVPLLELTRENALAALRLGDIESELAATLDHWGLIRDALRTKTDAPDPAGTARLREIALALDAGDAWRSQLRALLPNAATEGARLLDLAARADLAAVAAVGCRVLGQALWNAGEQDAAVTVLRCGQELHPRDFDLCFQLALHLDLLDEPRPLEAFEVYRIAHAIRPEQNEVLHRQVLAMEGLLRHVDAERLTRLLIARDPRNPHWLHHLGNALNGQARYGDAIACYRKWIELNPTDGLAYGNLGANQQRLGQLDEALASLRKATELEPKEAAHHANLGIVLRLQGHLEEAIASLRKAIELNPIDANSYGELGIALGEGGDLEGAIASYRIAIELDPQNLVANSNIGVLLQELGELDEAIAACRRAIALFPEDALIHWSLGTSLASRGDLDEAIASFRRSLELDPRDTRTHNAIGIALRTQGRSDEARECFQRVLELDPRHAPATLNLGTCFTDQGNFERALVEFRKAGELFAADPSESGRDWLEQSRGYIARTERLLAQRASLDEVLAGREADSSEEWSAAIRSGYQRCRHRDVVVLAETTLRDAPALVDGVEGVYIAARSAALLAASEGAGLTAEERARLRELSRVWLGREVELWIEQVERGGEAAADGRGRLNHAQGDPDLASVRGTATLELPEVERAAWRALWKRIEEGAAK